MQRKVERVDLSSVVVLLMAKVMVLSSHSCPSLHAAVSQGLPVTWNSVTQCHKYNKSWSCFIDLSECAVISLWSHAFCCLGVNGPSEEPSLSSGISQAASPAHLGTSTQRMVGQSCPCALLARHRDLSSLTTSAHQGKQWMTAHQSSAGTMTFPGST